LRFLLIPLKAPCCGLSPYCPKLVEVEVPYKVCTYSLRSALFDSVGYVLEGDAPFGA
jgi:hypothetical protein